MIHSHSTPQPNRSPRLVALLLTLVSACFAFPLPAAEVADSAQYAWSENTGWVDARDSNGTMQVYSDHLEGYLWMENLGWVRLGTHTGGGSHTYDNNSPTAYGVNRDPNMGGLFGYAWSENAGWIRFDPQHGGVYADMITGDLDGYAWGENVGWVRFAPYTTMDNVCGTGIEYTPGTWQMLASPCIPTGLTVIGAFGDGSLMNLSNALYGDSSNGWALFTRNVDTVPSQYVMEHSNAWLFPTGTGYWFKSNQDPANGRLQYGGGGPTGSPYLQQVDGCTSAHGCVVVTVSTVSDDNRYNLVGNPFPYPINWNDVRVRVDGSNVMRVSQAANSGYIDPPVLSNQIWIWNGNSYDTYQADSYLLEGYLRYFTSFWVEVLPGAYGRTIELLIPARLDLSQTEPFDTERLVDASRPWYLAWLDWLIPPASADDGLIVPGNGLAEGMRRGGAQRAVRAAPNPLAEAEFDLLVTEGIVTYGLDPQEAEREAHAVAVAEGREWFVRLYVDEPETGFKDHNTVLGHLLTAMDGYDRSDLVELPPYTEPYLTLVFPHPGWGAHAGDYASDLRAVPDGQTDVKRDVWVFQIRADRPGTRVVLRWEGDAEVLRRSVLIDRATGKRIRPGNPRFADGLPLKLGPNGIRTLTWVTNSR